jgi:hypothetical protein
MKNLFWCSKKKNTNEEPCEIERYLDNMISYAVTNDVLDKKALEEIKSYFTKQKTQGGYFFVTDTPQYKKPYSFLVDEFSPVVTKLTALISFFFFSFVVYKYKNYSPVSQMRNWLEEISANSPDGIQISDGVRRALRNNQVDDTAEWVIYALVPLTMFFLTVYILYGQSRNRSISKENSEIVNGISSEVEQIEKKFTAFRGLELDILQCPIGFEIFNNTVFAITSASSARCYSAKNIKRTLIENEKDPFSNKPLSKEQLISYPLIDLIIYLLSDKLLDDAKKETWLKTLFQNPLGSKDELLVEPITYPDGFTCSKKDIELLKGVNPISGAKLGAPIKNITLEQILAVFKPELKEKNTLKK